MAGPARTALVTGANRGIGAEIAGQLARAGMHVLLGARNAERGASAAAELRHAGLPVSSVVLDVANLREIPGRIGDIEATHGAIDVLINNAAILIDGPGGFDARLVDLTGETLRATFETNVFGPAAVIRAVLPGMIARDYGRIVNMSSLAGQLAGMGAGFPAYRMSKAALNALTRIAAAEAGSNNIKVNACSPGWVRTALGGSDAPRTVEHGADTAVWLAQLDDSGPTGGFFHDRRSVAW